MTSDVFINALTNEDVVVVDIFVVVVCIIGRLGTIGSVAIIDTAEVDGGEGDEMEGDILFFWDCEMVSVS